jgi:hypothetical protein
MSNFLTPLDVEKVTLKDKGWSEHFLKTWYVGVASNSEKVNNFFKFEMQYSIYAKETTSR